MIVGSDCIARCVFLQFILSQPQECLSGPQLVSIDQDLMKLLSSLLDYLPLATTSCRSHCAERVRMTFDFVQQYCGIDEKIKLRVLSVCII